MEIALTNDEEIIMILSMKLSIPEIIHKIIQWKHKLEDKGTLNYHIERWETISSKYLKSLSLERDCHGIVIPQSYSIDSKYFISNKDKCFEFYNETGISYQVRSLLLEILDCPMGSLFNEHILSCTLFEWREDDDKIYSILSSKIMNKMKNNISGQELSEQVLSEQVLFGKRLFSS